MNFFFSENISYHQFPHPERNPDRFKAWVHIAGGKLDSPTDYELYRKKVICDIHFTDRDRNRNNRLNFLAVPSLHLPGKCDEAGTSEKVFLVPEPVIEESILAALKPTQAGKSDEAGISEKDFLVPEPVIERSSLTTLKLTLAGESDDVGLSEKITLLPESKHERSNPAVSESILTDDSARIIISEHNYCQLQKKAINKNKSNHQQREVPSFWINQLKTTRRKIKILQSNLMRSQKRNQNLKSRIASAEKMSADDLFKKLSCKMTTAAKIFTKMQYSQTRKKPSGRRFTLEEKVLSLSLYKKSPRSYPLLAKFFTLPSTKSLKRLLTKIEVEPGLNKCIFLKIKNTVKDLSPEDRLCSLIFDEMSISPQIHYNAAKDLLRGFTINGEKIADHVLVFMVKGLRKKFKQPIAYYFTNALNKAQLKEILKKVVSYVRSTGLKVVCTVCDQSTVNVSVINELIEDTRKKYLREQKQWENEIIEIGKTKLIPIFDVPHLIKGMRNNLLTKDLKYFDFEEESEKIVKWDYYKLTYEADKSYGELKCLLKITDEHIYVEKMRKMKVKPAAQIFSHTMAATAGHLVARGEIPAECQNLVKFTKLIDNLFDSLNSNTFHVPDGKIYKGCVRRNSLHHDLWKNAIKVLNTVKFVKKIKDNNKIRLIETKAIPSIKNLIRTIEGIQQIWILLSQTYSFDAMLTRNFNQDPLENFFGNIRSYGARNTAPDTVAFEGAFKSLLINNFNSPHSLHANCEKDEDNCLQNLDFFLKENSVLAPSTSDIPSPIDEEEPQFSESTDDEIVVPFINLNTSVNDVGQGNYVCGWVLNRCIKNVCKSCKDCKKNMYGDPESTSNEYIRAKEYKKNKQSLIYPSKAMEKCFIQIQNLVTDILKKDVPKKGLKHKIKMFTDIFVDYPFNCDKHKIMLKNYFENTVIHVLVYSWCRSINRILSGKITYHGEDEIKTAAQAYKNKHRHGINK